MLDYVLTFHGQAKDSIELHHKVRFTAHVAGVPGELRWGANGRLGEVETVRPDDLGVDPVPEDFVGPVPEAEVATLAIAMPAASAQDPVGTNTTNNVDPTVVAVQLPAASARRARAPKAPKAAKKGKKA